MNHQKSHWLEKLQVQLAAGVALAAIYFLFWGAFRPEDPQLPITFLPTGSFGQGLAFAGFVVLLSGACALVTISSRPQGALLAALIGAGGVSLRSHQIRSLLWTSQSEFGNLYLKLMVEIVLLGAVLLVASVAVAFIRGIIGRIRPGWVWKDPLKNLTDEQRKKAGKALLDRARFYGIDPASAIAAFLLNRFKRALTAAATRPEAQAAPGKTRDVIRRCLTFMLLGIGVGMALLLPFMQSADRGQILFALLASMTLAVLIAHQVFPTGCGTAAWGVPVALALLLYGLAAWIAGGAGDLGWADVPFYARALPIDWLTAGCGGAMLGFWISSRIHELRLLDGGEEKT